MRLGLDKLKDYGSSALAFGRRNAPSIMTGGGILIGWAAVYIFWRQGKKAEEKIRAQEAELNKDIPEDTPDAKKELPKKEKLTIYLQYCWMALALGIASSGLTVWAHKIDLSRLAEMYVVTQFLEKKNEDQNKLMEKLKEEVGDKKLHDLENDIIEEEYPDEELRREVLSVKGTGRTLFCDEARFNFKFRSEIEDVKDGIIRFNEMMEKKLKKAIEAELNESAKDKNKSLKEKLKDPMYVSTSELPYEDISPYPDTPVFVEEPLDTFLDYIGCEDGSSYLGSALVIRYYSHGARINPYSETVMNYKNFTDPATGVAQFCRLNYSDFVVPSIELEDRKW
jgi:hypothetical protein